MDIDRRNRWVLVGTTVIGGAGGVLAASRLGAARGASFGALGAVAGAFIGVLAGASMASLIVGEVEFPTRERPRHRLLTNPGEVCE